MAKWSKLAKINSGGFGTVFRAQADTGRVGAIKELNHPDDADDMARFRREVRLQSQLNHRHIVPILAHKLDDVPPWFLMPLANGNLRERLAQIKVNTRQAAEVFGQILAGVEYAHQDGIVHRDLKPENILFFTDEARVEYAAVGDFGLGRRLERDTPSLTMSHAALGTPLYAAPEQWDNAKAADHRADIYALGKMLYEMLTGRLPLVLEVKDVTGGLAHVILKCTDPNPDHRYQSIAELRSDFELLTTQRRVPLERPIEAANLLMKEIIDTGAAGRAKVRELVSLLLDNEADERLYQEIMPKLPDPVLAVMTKDHIHAFTRIFSKFDEHVSGALTFSYTDTVARFCERVYHACTEHQIRRLALERILTMGYAHNRFFVGEVFGRLVGRLNVLEEVLMARDILQANLDAAAWVSEEILRYKPHHLIVGLLKGLGD